MAPTTPSPSPSPSPAIPPTNAYRTVKVLVSTHRQLKLVALVRGETHAQVLDALVRRELARLRADGRLAETLDAGASPGQESGRAREER